MGNLCAAEAPAQVAPSVVKVAAVPTPVTPRRIHVPGAGLPGAPSRSREHSTHSTPRTHKHTKKEGHSRHSTDRERRRHKHKRTSSTKDKGHDNAEKEGEGTVQGKPARQSKQLATVMLAGHKVTVSMKKSHCIFWKAGKCNWGASCKYFHEGFSYPRFEARPPSTPPPPEPLHSQTLDPAIPEVLQLGEKEPARSNDKDADMNAAVAASVQPEKAFPPQDLHSYTTSLQTQVELQVQTHFQSQTQSGSLTETMTVAPSAPLATTELERSQPSYQALDLQQNVTVDRDVPMEVSFQSNQPLISESAAHEQPSPTRDANALSPTQSQPIQLNESPALRVPNVVSLVESTAVQSDSDSKAGVEPSGLVTEAEAEPPHLQQVAKEESENSLQSLIEDIPIELPADHTLSADLLDEIQLQLDYQNTGPGQDESFDQKLPPSRPESSTPAIDTESDSYTDYSSDSGSESGSGLDDLLPAPAGQTHSSSVPPIALSTTADLTNAATGQNETRAQLSEARANTNPPTELARPETPKPAVGKSKIPVLVSRQPRGDPSPSRPPPQPQPQSLRGGYGAPPPARAVRSPSVKYRFSLTRSPPAASTRSISPHSPRHASLQPSSSHSSQIASARPSSPRTTAVPPGVSGVAPPSLSRSSSARPMTPRGVGGSRSNAANSSSSRSHDDSLVNLNRLKDMQPGQLLKGLSVQKGKPSVKISGNGGQGPSTPRGAASRSGSRTPRLDKERPKSSMNLDADTHGTFVPFEYAANR